MPVPNPISDMFTQAGLHVSRSPDASSVTIVPLHVECEYCGIWAVVDGSGQCPSCGAPKPVKRSHFALLSGPAHVSISSSLNDAPGLNSAEFEARVRTAIKSSMRP